MAAPTCSELWPLCHSHKLVNLNFSPGLGKKGFAPEAHNWSKFLRFRGLACCAALGNSATTCEVRRGRSKLKAEVVVAWEWEPQSFGTKEFAEKAGGVAEFRG